MHLSAIKKGLKILGGKRIAVESIFVDAHRNCKYHRRDKDWRCHLTRSENGKKQMVVRELEKEAIRLD